MAVPRQEFVPLLVDELLRAPNTELANAATYALQLIVTSATPRDTVLRLGFGELADVTLQLLLRIGTAAAFDHAVTYLKRQLALDGRSDALRVAGHLVLHQQRHELAPLIWNNVRATPRSLLDEHLLPAVGYVEDEAAEDFLTTKAFGTEAPSLPAIEGLAVSRKVLAFEAAHRALQRPGRARAPIVDALFAIDPAKAVDVALQHLAVETNALVREYIGRAVRHHETPAARTAAETLLASTDARERAAGCQLAGWLHAFPADLKDRALRDPIEMVRAFAMGAVLRHRDRRRTQELLNAFKAAEGSRARMLLTLLIDTGDPLLLLDKRDKFWLGAYLTGRTSSSMAAHQQ